MPIVGKIKSSRGDQEPATVGARTMDQPPAVAALVVGAVALLTSPFWFIGGPLGVVALIGGLVSWRNGSARTRAIGEAATALGAVAALIALLVAVFLTAF